MFPALLINRIVNMKNKLFLVIVFVLTLGCFVLSLSQIYRINFSAGRKGNLLPGSAAEELKEIRTALEELSTRGKLRELTLDQTGAGPAKEIEPVSSQENLVSNLKIEILNGSGINGAATELKRSLEALISLNRPEISVGNADLRETILFEVKAGLDQNIRDIIYQEVEKESATIEVKELGKESPLDLVITLGSGLVD
ncbi:MAG: LytR C-terminal domain-containing protein [Patescibacteria group bacterium]|nr:LytR C-terminal domain-containing protein [Patescibacteria group bacterium]